ncbi:hypothetical protein HDU96_000299 [Phlyctochytrium bullatum]|nr:hypothetical protein HDU96_000299 [Phlyctochytrium bullatum]
MIWTSVATAVLALAPLLASAQSTAPLTMLEFVRRYSTTPYSDDFTKEPLTFATAARYLDSIASRRTFTNNGTLLVPSDNVYTAAGATTGGVAFFNRNLDYSVAIAQTPQGPQGLVHYESITDPFENITVIWDDFAPGRPIEVGQKFGNGRVTPNDRQIYIFSGNEREYSQCYVTAAVRCTDGMVQAVSCLMLPAPRFSTAVRNRQAFYTKFTKWFSIIERIGWVELLDNLPVQSTTIFYPNDDALGALPGSYTDEQLAKIVGWNIITDAAYPSSASPAIYPAPLFRPAGTQERRNNLTAGATDTNSGDVSFYGGFIRGTNFLDMPADLAGGSFRQLPGGASVPLGGTTTTTTTTTAAAATTSAPGATSAATTTGTPATTSKPASQTSSVTAVPTTTTKSGAAATGFGAAVLAMVAGAVAVMMA